MSSSGGGGKERTDSLPSADSDSRGLGNTHIHKRVRKEHSALFTFEQQLYNIYIYVKFIITIYY